MYAGRSRPARAAGGASVEGQTLKTDGPFAVVRHPMYLAVIAYHVGAALALQILSVLAVAALFVVPYTAIRHRLRGDAAARRGSLPE